jgi:LuxR family maltose regulon positive regulatory protein
MDRSSHASQRDLLLTTKLRLPQARPDIVSRPRLSKQLNEGLTRKLTLISAPPGFGKTTALSEWVSQSSHRVAWISLDEGDNDPARYWAYLIAALQTLQPDIGTNTAALLQSPQPARIESVLTTLVNEIDAFPENFTLVLDDYHMIESQAIHQALAFLIDHLPQQMHLIISSRVDPPLPLARLRARNQLSEIRAADLHFTRDEVTAFLNQMMALNLSTDDVAAIEARTEGWITGLQLAALSMKGLDDISGFITAFTGSHRHIVDYLTEEVLSHQPENIQAFLLQTSILDRLTGPLCDAVTGQNDSRAILTKLETANLFLIALDQERQWYRYHHLFADVLRGRLYQEQPDRLHTLHLQASQWYARNGFIPEAISHALAAQDFERAAELVEQIAAATFWIRGEVYTLLGWLRALPDAAVRPRTQLSLAYAWLLMWTGHLEEAASFLCTDSDLPETMMAEERRAFLGVATAIRAELTHLRGDLPGALELAWQATEYLSDTPHNWGARGTSLGILGGVYRASGDTQAAIEAYAEASRLMQREGYIVPTLVALGYLIQLRAMQGQLRQAAEVFLQAVRFATERRAQAIPTFGLAHISMGEVFREWNELETAVQHLQAGINLCQQWEGLADDVVDGYLTLARVKQAQGDIESAFAAIQQAEQIAHEQNVSWKLAHAATAQARLWIRQGNLDAANRWATGLPADAELSYEHQEEQIMLARLFITQGKNDQAAQLLLRLLEAVEAAGRVGRVIEILGLQALAQHQAKDITRALDALSRAFTLAEPEGYTRIFVDEGPAMQELIRQAAAGGIAVNYAAKLLDAFEQRVPYSKPTPPGMPPLIEPLSERELQILRLLAAGLSTREIADELVIAVGTVRNHVKSIYGKLDAHNRVQALERARALTLL